jgi:hypothetical protein
MYNTWTYSKDKSTGVKGKVAGESAYQERERRARANEIVDTLVQEFEKGLPPMISSEVTSEFFKQRGIPCMDEFTSSQLFSFRRAFGFRTPPQGTTRSFLVLSRWKTPRCAVTMWTIEPVVSTTVMRGNSIDVS